MSDIPTVKLEVGDLAPDFIALTQSGEKIVLSEVLRSGKKVLIVFYPGDDTPGCTKQLCGIRDVYSEYAKLGVRVFGINHGDAKSHQKFIDKYSYQFDILVDEDKSIAKDFGAIKKFFAHYILKRGVFLINFDGTITYRFWGQHDNQKVIEAIQGSK